MKSTTYNIVKATLDGDETLAEADRQRILAACRGPIIAVLPAVPHDFSRLVPVGEAASLLSVHPRTVWRLIRARRLRSVRVGSSRRVGMDDLAAFAGRGETSVFHGSTSTPDVEMAKTSRG